MKWLRISKWWQQNIKVQGQRVGSGQLYSLDTQEAGPDDNILWEIPWSKQGSMGTPH